MFDFLEKNFNFKNFIKSISIIYIYFCSNIFVLIPAKIFNFNLNNLSLNQLTYLNIYISVILVLIIFGFYFKDLIKEFKSFTKNFLNNFDIGIKYWLLGLAVMFISNIILLTIFKSSGANNEAAVQSLIKANPAVMGLYTCLLAPFIEEIIFRKTLKDFIKNKWILVIISFLFFGGAHVLSMAKTFTDLLYIIPYGALGATFAYAYYKTDTVFTTVTFHIIHNTVLFLISSVI